MFEVTDPSADSIVYRFLALLIPHAIASRSEKFQFGLELSKRFSMDAKPSNAVMGCIERVTKELDVPHTARNGLFAIDF